MRAEDLRRSSAVRSRPARPSAARRTSVRCGCRCPSPGSAARASFTGRRTRPGGPAAPQDVAHRQVVADVQGPVVRRRRAVAGRRPEPRTPRGPSPRGLPVHVAQGSRAPRQQRSSARRRRARRCRGWASPRAPAPRSSHVLDLRRRHSLEADAEVCCDALEPGRPRGRVRHDLDWHGPHRTPTGVRPAGPALPGSALVVGSSRPSCVGWAVTAGILGRSRVASDRPATGEVRPGWRWFPACGSRRLTAGTSSELEQPSPRS